MTTSFVTDRLCLNVIYLSDATVGLYYLSSATILEDLVPTIVLEPGLQSHCRKGLASAPVLELSSLTSVAPAPELNVFKC